MKAAIFIFLGLLAAGSAWLAARSGYDLGKSAAVTASTSPASRSVSPHAATPPSLLPLPPHVPGAGTPDELETLLGEIPPGSPLTVPDHIAAALRSTPDAVFHGWIDRAGPLNDTADKTRQQWFSLVFQELLRRDPSAAMDRAEALASGDAGRNLLWSLLENHWGISDPAAAWRWMTSPARNAEMMSELHNAVVGVASSYAHHDPDAAFAAWLRLPPEPAFNEYASEILCRDATQPAQRTARLAEILALPPGPRRTAGMKGILDFWVQNESLAAAGVWLEAQTLPDVERLALQRGMAAAAAPNDPQAALGWLLARANPAEAAEDLSAITVEWASEAPNACAEWLATLPPFRGADYAISAFVQTIQTSDPASAFAWTRRMRSGSRETRARLVWEIWRRQAPVSAVAFIPQLDASEREWLGMK